MNKQLSIRLYNELAGILEQDESGNLSFSYDKEAKQAISVAMPLSDTTYNNRACQAFFGGLLPESPIAKKLIGLKYGVNGNNTFALLKAIGHDCAGAISCFEVDEPSNYQKSQPLCARVLSEEEWYTHIKELPKKPLLMGVDGLRLSLAGVHDKAAVCLVDDRIAIPENGCPSTHIIKPATQTYEGLVENEYFCLQVAAAVGMSIPKNEIRMIKDIHYLLIERYDRRIINNTIERIHQEDFCQASGIVSTIKYQNEGGPGFNECFALLNETIQPAIARNRLIEVAVFNFLIGNMDAHSKNFSLLHKNTSQFDLAPFYDLVCTRVYPELSSKMAMKIGKEYDSDKVILKNWEQFSKDIGYSFPALKRIISEKGEALLSALDEKERYFNAVTKETIIERIIELTKKHVHKTLEML